MKEYPKFKVTVRCFTFNHVKYVTDTLDGFCKQRTNFPYICTIVDDASTDGEPDILKCYFENNFQVSDSTKSFVEETEYATIYYSQHKENLNCYFAILLLKYNHYSIKKSKLQYLSEWRSGIEYEALCEGDDYWTDPYKLQKQIDLLDANPNCMLTFHAINEIYMNRPYLNHIRAKVENRIYSGPDWYLKRPAQYASFVLRLRIYDNDFYRSNVIGKFPVGDIPLLLACSKYGTIIGISDIMSVYRHNEGGWTSQERNKDEVWNIAKSHLQYKIFGPEYTKATQFFYQRECMGYFFTCLKRGKIYPEFLVASLKVSLSGTLKSIILVLKKKYV